MQKNAQESTEPTEIAVWDRFVRIFHWAVVIGFFTAYFTDGGLLSLHIWAGYTVGALVVIRVIWGFSGPRHARFSDFLCSPFRAARYVIELVLGRAARHLGHSPAGGLMVAALLVGLMGASLTGYQHLNSEEHDGAMASSSASTSPSLSWSDIFISSAHAHGEETHNGAPVEPEFWGQVHGWLADLLLMLAVLHLGGVALASFAHRENLVRAMINGKKRID